MSEPFYSYTLDPNQKPPDETVPAAGTSDDQAATIKDRAQAYYDQAQAEAEAEKAEAEQQVEAQATSEKKSAKKKDD